MSVVDLTSQGLNRPILFRGMNDNNEHHDQKTIGLVMTKRGKLSRASGPDTFFPEDTVKHKKGLFNYYEEHRKVPSLQKDSLFANKEAEGKGSIHLDYKRIPPARGLLLRDEGAPPMPWTIVHEATHKFARTRDVNGGKCYSERDCREVHWTMAVRNATHYERYMLMDWTTRPERNGDGWKYNVFRMRANP